MSHWSTDAILYHIYPLGFCGAPEHNDFCSPAVPRLNKIYDWLDHIQGLGANALYLGPLFESSHHGYDTVDYYHGDRRLGNNAVLKELSTHLHQRGMRLILDGVFNHVGRDFWAFYDLRTKQQDSAYCHWFHNLTFGKPSPYGDPFTYESWNGCYDLVKLNLQNPAVKQHLFGAVEMWVREFGIDGLRLDAADCIDMAFLQELSAFCRSLRPDFFLVGEVVHGDYRKWVNPSMLDSVTNYECYKGLYSSHVDKNYFEIAYALNRQFGAGGMYRGSPLYNFADNHDVNRVASRLTNTSHLYPLYCLLFTMPGVPSIYYGSEWGILGKKDNGSDAPLRPHLELAHASQSAVQPDLARTIGRLAQIRQNSPALRNGTYQQLLVKSEQLAFARQCGDERVVVLLNAANQPAYCEIDLPWDNARQAFDLLNPSAPVAVQGKKIRLEAPACWAQILRMQ